MMTIIWIAAMVIFGVVEAVTVGLASIWFVVGSVAGLIAAICGGAGGGLGSPAGASSTLLTYFYMNSFNYYKVGYGCAVAIVLLLIIVAVNLIQNRITDSGDQD